MAAEPEDFWADEAFEDAVAAALIACYETKVHEHTGAVPGDRLDSRVLDLIRKEGPYIGSRSRWFAISETANGYFDVKNDILPQKGLFASIPVGPLAEDLIDAYFFMLYCQKTDKLGKYWQRRAGGQLYEMLDIAAHPDGLRGERSFFSVTNDGEVVACDQRVPMSHGYSPGRPERIRCLDDKYLAERGFWGAVALQSIADRRFCWTITARECVAKAHLGCMQEEVKSLLCARDLPLTATGRKRPILHLVEAHKRRMANGTDVDVSAFLRGQQTVIIEGTEFRVSPPLVIRPNVSKNSAARYFDIAED